MAGEMGVAEVDLPSLAVHTQGQSIPPKSVSHPNQRAAAVLRVSLPVGGKAASLLRLHSPTCWGLPCPKRDHHSLPWTTHLCEAPTPPLGCCWGATEQAETGGSTTISFSPTVNLNL